MNRREELNAAFNPVVSVDEDSYVYGVWVGPAGPEASVLVTLYKTEGGPLARGRVRIHRDDKLFGSEDEKHVFELRGKKGASPHIFRRRAASRIRALVKDFGDRESARALKWIPVNGNAEAMVEALERAALKDESFSLGIQMFGERRTS
jgi:hypothetical protein